MTPEERKAKDAARKREAYRRRKEAQADLSNNLPKQPIFESTPNPEADERWRTVQTDGKPAPKEELALRLAKANGIAVPPGVLYQDHREHARAVQAESVAREEYIDLLFSKFERCTNIPQLLQAILREQITLRVTLTDLIGGLRK